MKITTIAVKALATRIYGKGEAEREAVKAKAKKQKEAQVNTKIKELAEKDLKLVQQLSKPFLEEVVGNRYLNIKNIIEVHVGYEDETVEETSPALTKLTLKELEAEIVLTAPTCNSYQEIEQKIKWHREPISKHDLSHGPENTH